MFAPFSKPVFLAGALVLSVLASTASATPVSLVYNGPTATDPKNATIVAAPVAYPGAGDWPKAVGAWGFRMTDTSGPLGSFVAWCLDLGAFLGTSGTHAYKITSDPFGNSYGMSPTEKARVQNVFDANYAALDLSVGNQVAGFQLALWDALYDGDGNIGTGAFQATASATITGLANGYLAAAAGWVGARQFQMTFLESTTAPRHQNLVTVSAVPLPAAGWLMLMGLGGLGMMARRRMQRA